jgi:hypothetical protein
VRRPIPPNLDDRSFAQLRAEAIERIRAVCPEWTDFSPSDPGIALAEVFAYLTQTLLYRLNRVPDKQYRAFLSLLGVGQLPPAAATVQLEFTRTGGDASIEIPRGTRVTADTIVFTTTQPVRLEKGQERVSCPAFHGEFVDGEVLGVASGAPGLEFTVARAPVVAPMDDHLDLVVAVEETEPMPPEARAVRFGEKTFRIWPEVPTFADLRPGERACAVDRLTGVIRFPPAVSVTDNRGQLLVGDDSIGAIPPPGREIRVSYRTGGGSAGNVRPATLVTLKDRIAGVAVTNPDGATGGRDAESLDHLLVRGPIDFHRLHRAVTARDYEALARRAGGIARAKAFTKADIWRHASAGVVEVAIVPSLGAPGHHTLDDLRAAESAQELAKVQRALDDASLLASRSEVHWTRCKPVSIRLTAVVSREEDVGAVRTRILERIDRLITPLPRSAWDEGWPYGRALRRYDIEGTVRTEPGVLYVTGVELRADLMPAGEITTVTVDGHQERTWFAGTGHTVYRTTNAGDGWELIKEFAGGAPEESERVLLVRASPLHEGVVTAVVAVGGAGCRVYVSRDCGESWEQVLYLQETVARDAAWSDRDGTPLLFIATDDGLYEFLPGQGPLLVAVDTEKPNRGFNAVVVHQDVRGITYVAVATNDRSGVFLSREGGRSKSFANLGLTENVIELAIQVDGVRSFLWAGFAHPDVGAARYELAAESSPEGWVSFDQGWGEAGSCLAFGFLRDGRVVAGSHSHGILWIDPKLGAQWQRPSLDNGLPIRDETVEGTVRLLFPVGTITVDRSAAADRIVVGTVRGVYRAGAPEERYESVSEWEQLPHALREVVTLPPTWLFCSGRHEIEVVPEEAGGR